MTWLLVLTRRLGAAPQAVRRVTAHGEAPRAVWRVTAHGEAPRAVWRVTAHGEAIGYGA